MKGIMTDDKILVENIRMGDMQSFTEVYRAYHSYLFHFALKFLKSSELAEELVHDVFLKLWENRVRLDAELSLKGYLIKICKNHIINLLSRASREKAIMLEISKSGSTAHNETENAIMSADYEAHADSLISQLPPQRQKVFRMYRFEEMNPEEISRQLGISKGTVKDHLLKANRFIRKYLQASTGIPLKVILLLTILYEAFLRKY